VFNFSGHNAIINTLSVNAEGVFFSGGQSFFLIGSLNVRVIGAQAIMEA
jgi:hypothetical protein